MDKIYVLIKDGAVVDGPRNLPENWENVSRLDLAEPELLIELGWYPLIVDPVPAYDAKTQRLETKHVIEETHVRETFDIVQLASAELEEMEIANWQFIRYERDRMLQESDWTELPSVRKLHGEQWGQDWDSYRQALRDITNATSTQQVVWPTKPT